MASHDHGGGGGVVGGVGKADVNFKDATGVSIDFGAAMKPDLGLAARFADNFHVAPSELMADAGAEGFADGLLGGEARGEMDVWFFHGLRISDFALEKDAVEKTVAEALDGIGDWLGFDNVHAYAEDGHEEGTKCMALEQWCEACRVPVACDKQILRQAPSRTGIG